MLISCYFGFLHFSDFAWRATIIDRKGNKTAKLAERFPVLVKRKFLVQIGGAMAFVIVFGLISLLLDLPIKVFFIVCGVVVGVINGMAVTLMYRD